MASDDSDTGLKLRSPTFCLMLGASTIWILVDTVYCIWANGEMELNLLSQSDV